MNEKHEHFPGRWCQAFEEEKVDEVAKVRKKNGHSSQLVKSLEPRARK
jgi:hypothetical protein